MSGDPPAFKELPVNRRGDNYYDGEEIKALLSQTHRIQDGPLVSDALVFFLLTAARLSEAVQLPWSAVDFRRGELTFYNTKNGEDRVLPMDGELLELMQRLHHDRIDDGLVFPIKGYTLRRRLKRLQDLAGIGHDRCIHTLRHTVCTSLWEKGADLPTVMAIMGHRKPETSMIYSHAKRNNIRRALMTL